MGLTYTDLVNKKYDNNPQVNSQIKRNSVSILKKWVLWLKAGPDLSVQINDDFNEKFEEKLEHFLEGRSTTDIYNFRSHLRKWFELYHSTVASSISIEGHNLASYVNLLLTRKGKKISDLERLLETTSVYDWFSHNKIPHPSNWNRINQLSKYFGLPENFLVDSFLRVPNKFDIKIYDTGPSEYNRKMTKLSKDLYRIGKKEYLEDSLWENVRKEVQEYVKHKTSPVSAIGNLKNRSTGSSPEEGRKRKKKRYWKKGANGKYASEKRYLEFLKSFFGYLKNIKKESQDWTIALCLNEDLLHDFLQFYIERQGGEVTSTISDFIQHVISMCQYYAKYPKLLKDKEALTWIKEIRNNFQDQDTQLKKIVERMRLMELDMLDIKPSRDEIPLARNPKDKISKILNEEKPLEPLFKMLDYLHQKYKQAYLSAPKQKSTHILCRDIVLLHMIIEKPTRGINLNYLDLEKNIQKLPEGNYKLILEKKNVKNNKEIVFIFSGFLSKLIDLYLERHRSSIFSDSKYLFPTKNGECFTEGALSKNIKKITKTILGVGLGTHDFRKIRPTDYARRYPGDYAYLADLLNDSISTVMKHYNYNGHENLRKNDAEYLKGYHEKLVNK